MAYKEYQHASNHWIPFLLIASLGASTMTTVAAIEQPKDPRTTNAFLAATPIHRPDGSTASVDSLKGLSVGLYFAGEWCPISRRVLPGLVEWYHKANASEKKVELIFVSSDLTDADFARHQAQMPWLSLQFKYPETDRLKERYRIWSGIEVNTLGDNRRGGIPAIIVVDSKGNELQWLDTEQNELDALSEWKFEENNRRFM